MDLQNVQPGLAMGEEKPEPQDLPPQLGLLPVLLVTNLLVGGWEFNFSVYAPWAEQR